ncbi:uncharacterized protein LOC110830208 [Zootermopsis nevadensis]|uniref:Gustatory receptor n=1 Tax=Zootermopsis nevadensis TaxID=136037 RepID=A0A067RFY3_ZOONE|nr:uncharacterized protein LOC110830208 [Zootermopsis nevadensis]KDR19118.1 hypothetical protein L798_07000 [Zootermopsis nevadensis]
MTENTAGSGQIYVALKPLTFICALFGLFPCSFGRNRADRTEPTVCVFLNIVCSLVWICLFAVRLCLKLLHLSSDNVTKVRILTEMSVISTHFTSIICLVHLSIVCKNKFIRLLEKVSQADYGLFTLSEEKYVNRRTNFIIITELAVMLLLFISYEISYEIYTAQTRSKREVLDYITQVITLSSYICNTLTVLLINNCVLIVTQRQRHLNKQLTTFISCPNRVNKISYCGHIKPINKRNATTPYVSLIRVETSNHVSGNQEIHSIRILYNQLYDVACIVNYLYGLPLLAMSCWILLDLVLITYVAVTSLDVDFIITNSKDIIFFLIFLKMIIMCQISENEIQSSIILVQKVMLEDDLGYKDCKELLMLSAQLRDMKIKYTACKFFTLNLPYLCSVVGAVVSYVIIMIQIE